jgi:CubicO group peptidase (beta-lactamase class C family)
MHRRAVLPILALLSVMTPASAADSLPRAAPETVGFSAERLGRIGEVLRVDVEQGKLPGMVVAVARRGKLVYFEAIGFQDKAAGVPMATDSIFSIASMTKPMTTVGALMFYEQARLLLNDPVGKYLPPIGKMQVAVLSEANRKGDGAIATEPPTRPMTVQDLMRHTSGLIYAGRGQTAVHKLYPASITEMTGSELVAKLATLPLYHQPGAAFEYSISTDVLGIVVEALSEQTLGAYLQERIWKPLGMNDTSFMIPPEKAGRYARPLPIDPDSGKPQTMRDSTKATKLECGGGCAASTAGDYIRFAQMLLNKGKLGEVRILGHKTVELMTANHLPSETKNNVAVTSSVLAGYGFGLGVAVRQQAGIAPLLGSVGDYTWSGAFGTAFSVDPAEELIIVQMAQMPGSIALRGHYRQVINALVYQAMID